jgi:hypothetical protein
MVHIDRSGRRRATLGAPAQKSQSDAVRRIVLEGAAWDLCQLHPNDKEVFAGGAALQVTVGHVRHIRHRSDDASIIGGAERMLTHLLELEIDVIERGAESEEQLADGDTQSITDARQIARRDQNGKE